MIFTYRCKECGKGIEADFRIGKAPSEIGCECGAYAKRSYESMSFVLKGGGWPSQGSRLNTEMTKRNEAAGRRQGKEWGSGPVKTVAHDYGNGDVREVKK